MARLRKFSWSPRWYVVWGEGRESRRLSTGTSDKVEAERFVARFESAKGRPPETFDINLLCDAYLEDRKPMVRAFGSLEFSLKAPREHFGLLHPNLVNKALVRAYVAKRRYQGRRDGTIDKELRTLRQALAWGVREEWMGRAPYIESPGGGPARQRWLTRAEAGKLLDACVEPHVRMFMLLALHTGARAGTILDLTWDRVDLERGLVIYPPASQRSRKRTAVVPINKVLRPALDTAREFALSDWVVEWRGKPITKIAKGFKEARRRSGIAHCTIHDLRRTCASWMLQEGQSFAAVAAYIGDTEDMVRKVYGQFAPDWLRAAAESLEG
jgi:integrase